MWRGGTFLSPGSVSVNTTDGSCWVGDGGYGRLVHLSAAGAELSRLAGGFVLHLGEPHGWLLLGGGRRRRGAPPGERGGAVAVGRGEFSGPTSVSVNPADGSCWVADYGHDQVVHVSPAGAELWRSNWDAFSFPESVSLNSGDGSCWVADTSDNQVVHLSQSGAELWRSASGAFSGPHASR